jgi:hypothetical protein
MKIDYLGYYHLANGQISRITVIHPTIVAGEYQDGIETWDRQTGAHAIQPALNISTVDHYLEEYCPCGSSNDGGGCGWCSVCDFCGKRIGAHWDNFHMFEKHARQTMYKKEPEPLDLNSEEFPF